MWNELLTTLVSHLALFFQKSKPSMQLLLMLKTRSKRPKLKTDLSLRIRGVCQDSTLTHEIFDNYYFGSKRLEKHCNPTSNWVYLEMTPIVYCGKKSINAAAKMGICIHTGSKIFVLKYLVFPPGIEMKCQINFAPNNNSCLFCSNFRMSQLWGCVY